MFPYCNEPQDWRLYPLPVFEKEINSSSCRWCRCFVVSVWSLPAAAVLIGHLSEGNTLSKFNAHIHSDKRSMLTKSSTVSRWTYQLSGVWVCHIKSLNGVTVVTQWMILVSLQAKQLQFPCTVMFLRAWVERSWFCHGWIFFPTPHWQCAHVLICGLRMLDKFSSRICEFRHQRLQWFATRVLRYNLYAFGAWQDHASELGRKEVWEFGCCGVQAEDHQKPVSHTRPAFRH